MSWSLAKSALAACALAGVAMAGSESERAVRGYVLAGELLLFPTADQNLPAGWSVLPQGIQSENSTVLGMSGLSELTASEGQLVSLNSKPMPTGQTQLVLTNGERTVELGELSLATVDGKWMLLSTGVMAGRPVFEVVTESQTFTLRNDEFILAGELVLSDAARAELGIDSTEARQSLGAVTFLGSAMFDAARPVAAAAAPAGGIGPDVIVSTIGSGFGEYGAVSGVGAYAVTTVSCNVGDAIAIWIDSGAQPNRHPVIGTQLYRYKTVNGATRFEQIGMSWLKHGFCAADAPSCTNINPNGIPNPTYVGQASCDWLGLFATDTYSDGLNASQPGCGPRSEIQPWTGAYPFPYILGAGATGNATYKRLAVKNTDLDPALNAGAQYWCEVVYICTDEAEAQRYNNYSVRQATVGAFSGGQYNMSFTGSTIPLIPAVQRWAQIDAGVSISFVDVPNDGRLYLARKVTNLGGGQHNYEYALFNMNSDRGACRIAIPLPSGASATDIGFTDVDYHSGEPYSGTDWTPIVVPGTSLTWQTDAFTTNPNANALRWSTTYNYRFRSNAAPTTGDVTVTLFKPGTPTTVTFTGVEVPGSSCGIIGPYCTSSITSNFCIPSMGGSGTPSASAASGFTLSCTQVEGNKQGLFYYGMNQSATSWAVGSSSIKCVANPTQRLPALNSGGATGSCAGVLSIDWNAWRASSSASAVGSPFAAGQTFHAQAWFRDPPAPKATNLSNGFTFTLCP